MPENLNPDLLFLRPEFLKIQGNHLSIEADGVSISLYGTTTWKSPAMAPFGGFIFNGNNNPDSLSKLLITIDQLAVQYEIDRLEIRFPPDVYHPMEEIIGTLLRHGFQIAYSDVNFHLHPDGPFIRQLHRSERWKLRKAIRTGFSFEAVADPDWAFVHRFIRASRERKGYQLSMTEAELSRMHRQFPDLYRVWKVVSPDGKTAALALTIQVSDHIEYVFYTADDPVYRKVSPVVMLHQGIYNIALEEGKTLLDLGTASLHGNINAGVADFKRFLGGKEGRKHLLSKIWKRNP